ncbi:hypothetical protein BGZ70_002894, partial [Mortierella alpina]
NYKNINKWLAELKNIDSSLKTLDKEISTNAKLISAWGCNEGEDLTDICQRMTQLMEHTAYRKMIKGLKTQEMALDDNRKKKQDLTNQIAKQQKSSKENPIKMMELQNAYERVSAELLAQELDLLQFKRLTIRDAFNAQFDAMIEFAEKMALIAGFGRQITNVIDVGPQEAEKTTLYGGAEYTAAAINQVRVAVTSWQAQPVDGPIRAHIAPTQDDLALSAAAAAYNSSPTQHYRADSYSPTGSHSNSHSFANGEDDVQVLKLNASHTSLNENGNDYDSWKQEIHGAADRADDYLSPPATNPDTTPYNLSSPSQQHYQNAAATVANGLRHSSPDGYGNGSGGGAGHGSSTLGGRPFTPTTLRRSDTTDMYTASSHASPSPSYSSYQHQPASYESSVSPVPARGYRLGFVDPRERSRMERMDNSDLYKSDIGTTAGPRYPRSTAVVMDEK